MSTRGKPNAFNHLHQLHKKLRLGGSLDAMISQWQSPKHAKEIYGMGPTEASAVIHLMRGIPMEAVSRLQAAAAKHGMVRGVFTHAALASKSITVGFTPDVASSEWKSRMQNTPDTVLLLTARMLSDWTSMPVAMRKPLGPDQVANLQKVCAAFIIMKTIFATLIPSDQVDTEWTTVEASFMSGCMDIVLLEAISEGMWPWDLQTVPECRTVLVKLSTDMEAKQLAKHNELKRQVETATLTQLNAELTTDLNRLDTYFAKLAEIRRHWANTVLTHKRRRYTKGLDRVRSLMRTQLQMLVTEPTSAPMEVAAFKKVLADSFPLLKETCASGHSTWHGLLSSWCLAVVIVGRVGLCNMLASCCCLQVHPCAARLLGDACHSTDGRNDQGCCGPGPSRHR